MKLSAIGGALAVMSVLATAAAASAAAPNCIATCNTANAQCRQAGKNDSTCLYAWHQCKVGCTTPATPAASTKLQVSRPAANTVVIKAATPAARH